MIIQVDMFSVGLGAALLLRFGDGAKSTTVLADAGLAKYRVREKVANTLGATAQNPLAIDLMIGTHYDADHLDGLIEIARDTEISIGEAWLPPVANDTETAGRESRFTERSLLSMQLAQADGDEVLERYLTEKARICDEIAALERRVGGSGGLDRNMPPIERRWERVSLRDTDCLEQVRAYFRDHIASVSRSMEVGYDLHHANESIDSDERDELLESARQSRWWEFDSAWFLENSLSRLSVEEVRNQTATLGLIRASEAKDAINAISLAELIAVLKARKVRCRFCTIRDGEPREFAWSSGRFNPVAQVGESDLKLTLLGPSDGLVEKHRHRLPISRYLMLAYREMIPIKPITPSNQLSYVMVFEYSGQRVLVTGDAGCVDFRPSRQEPYYPALLKALVPLHVVQVAHHGGNNAHFYRCLLEANLSRQDPDLYLLLSHDVRDRHRPSEAFRYFIEKLRRSPQNTKVLFTSEPQEARVRDFISYIAAPVGSPPSEEGDVRLTFKSGAWSVDMHSINIQ